MAKKKKGKQGWVRRAVGEISKLRQTASGLVSSGSQNIPYVLDSTSKVEYLLARELYHNINDNYKLGAGFAKLVINTLAGFMGVPHFHSEDEVAQQTLDDHIGRWTSRMQRTHQLNLREGDCFVMLANLETDDPLYPEEKIRIDFIIIPPEQVTNIEIDPFTRKVKAYTLEAKAKWKDEQGNEKEYSVSQKITPDEIEIKVEGEPPEGVESEIRPNQWGFIPILHFKNEPEETQLHGISELEPIEPYMKAYHDVMMHAMQGSKMHSTPRLKMNLTNVEEFLRVNFPDALEMVEKGQPANINLKGHELLIFTGEDDASFIEVQSAIGDAEALLKLLFYCIVDTSEVPEFAFGVHTPSSHASVKEQMPLLIRRVARKREMVTETWQLLARMLLVMQSKVTGKNFESYEVGITWDAIIERDQKEYADTIKTLVDALDVALESKLISLEAAVNLLQQYIETMQEYETDDEELPGERERIIKTWIMRRRLEDGEGLEEGKKKIEEELKDAPGPGQGDVNAV